MIAGRPELRKPDPVKIRHPEPLACLRDAERCVEAERHEAVDGCRQQEGQQQKIRVPVKDIRDGKEKNFSLQPGDIVFVPESFF